MQLYATVQGSNPVLSSWVPDDECNMGSKDMPGKPNGFRQQVIRTARRSQHKTPHCCARQEGMAIHQIQHMQLSFPHLC